MHIRKHTGAHFCHTPIDETFRGNASSCFREIDNTKVRRSWLNLRPSAFTNELNKMNLIFNNACECNNVVNETADEYRLEET
jgi:hypothetical protein